MLVPGGRAGAPRLGQCQLVGHAWHVLDRSAWASSRGVHTLWWRRGGHTAADGAALQHSLCMPPAASLGPAARAQHTLWLVVRGITTFNPGPASRQAALPHPPAPPPAVSCLLHARAATPHMVVQAVPVCGGAGVSMPGTSAGRLHGQGPAAASPGVARVVVPSSAQGCDGLAIVVADGMAW